MYDAVVYDLDGTLVHLDVDWVAVERGLAELLADAGIDADGLDTWAMLDAAESAGLLDRAHALVAEHERAGARMSSLLPAADDLPRDERTGVCSLNAEDACRIALDRHGLTEHVGAVVGRDTVPARKPDPRALLAAVEALDTEPERTLFVGDSAGDEETARRAGTDFARVEPPWDEPADGPLREQVEYGEGESGASDGADADQE